MALIRNFSDAFWQMDKPGLKVDLRKPDVKRELGSIGEKGTKIILQVLLSILRVEVERILKGSEVMMSRQCIL